MHRDEDRKASLKITRRRTKFILSHHTQRNWGWGGGAEERGGGVTAGHIRWQESSLFSLRHIFLCSDGFYSDGRRRECVCVCVYMCVCVCVCVCLCVCLETKEWLMGERKRQFTSRPGEWSFNRACVCVCVCVCVRVCVCVCVHC